MSDNPVLFETLIRLADDHLILGHRLSEWCGHAPMLEEDLAMPNIALDLLGQARTLYAHAGEIEGAGRDEDNLAFLRLERDYKNALLTELPNGDFAQTMLRQYYFSEYMDLFWHGCLQSTDTVLAEIAAKAVKETAYHIRHSAEWIIRLGDGTEESHAKMKDAVDFVTPYCAELFLEDQFATDAAQAGYIPFIAGLKPEWEKRTTDLLQQATLTPPEKPLAKTGGRQGRHLEDMGHLLAELQYMQRTYPNMSW